MEAGSQVLQACGVGGVASSGQEAVGFASDDCVEGGPNLGDASRAREVSGDGLKGDRRRCAASWSMPSVVRASLWKAAFSPNVRWVTSLSRRVQAAS